MRLRHLMCLTVSSLALAGCTQLYNGAWGFKKKDQATAQQYAQEKQDRDAALAAAQADQANDGQDDKSRSLETQEVTLANSGQHLPQQPQFEDGGAAQTIEGYHDNARAAAMRPLSLFGQVPEPQPQIASPLDSPDNLRRISFSTEGADFDPDIDPSGQWIVYASTRHRHTADLYISRIGSTAVTQITSDPANDVMPAFSPDGKRIAFASDRTGNWDIYIMDVGGGQAVQLTSDGTHDIHPSFSPDGKYVVYCSYGAQSGQWELVVLEIDNPATRRFVGHGLFPNWSPKDSRIVYQRARERGTRWFSVWTLELENGEGVRPTEIAASANAAAITPDWSPDGRYVVFTTVLNPDAGQDATPAQADVWIVGSNGTGRANLTNSHFANLQPVWSQDGAVYFVSNRGKDGIDNVWSIQPERAVAVVESSVQVGEERAARDARPAPQNDDPDGAAASVPVP